MAQGNVSASVAVRPYYGVEKAIPSATTPVAQRTISFTLEPRMPTTGPITPMETVPGYENLVAPPYEKLEFPMLPAIQEKPLIVDIETTGFDPTNDRLICIGAKDAAETDESFELFAGDDEKQILQEFLQFYTNNNYTEIVGIHISFDLAFILRKCMLHGLQAREVFTARWTDLQDIIRKGREDFIPSGNKATKLNVLLEDMLGRKAPMTDEEALIIVAKGDDTPMLKIVGHHTVGTQILYRMWKNVVENSYSTSHAGFIPGVGEKNEITNYKQCESCLAGRQLQPEETGWVCDICGASNKA